MSDVVIVVIPKPGNPELCSLYRPISLLNADMKLFSKIFANQLNTVITALVHPDQSCFIPGRGTDITIRRLHTHMTLATPDRPGVVASLDAEKAFNSVEWGFLWAVLAGFGFGPRFLSWLQLLYARPRASVRTNGILSDSFPLGRGTLQGCPLFPGLKPLAILLLAEPGGQGGIPVNSIMEKLALYADDVLLFLEDVSTSLCVALDIFDRFGHFSGIRSNWDSTSFSPTV